MELRDLAELRDDWGFNIGGYNGLIESAGVSVLVDTSDDDYQGDSLLLVRDGERFGVVTYGWGSCSGCDAFQACDTLQDFTELRQDLLDGIVWGTLDETHLYLRSHDWEGSFLYSGLHHRFIPVALTALEALTANLITL